MTNVHRIQFTDGYLAYSAADTAGQVYRVYEATLGRAPDQQGLTNWANALNSGTSLQSVVNGFVGSQEFQSIYGPNLSDTNFVTLLYNNVLHRVPDQAGLNNWVNLLASGQDTRAQVVSGFTESQEDITNLAAPVQQGLWVGDPSAAKIARLYDAVLGREPDAAGLANWVGLLASGQDSRAQVVLGFSESPEHIANLAPHIDNGIWVAG